jgi:hypothetical protein
MSRIRCSTADDYGKVLERARATVGRVAIANSDAGGDAYAHLAIDQAARAVRDLVVWNSQFEEENRRIVQQGKRAL